MNFQSWTHYSLFLPQPSHQTQVRLFQGTVLAVSRIELKRKHGPKSNISEHQGAGSEREVCVMKTIPSRWHGRLHFLSSWETRCPHRGGRLTRNGSLCLESPVWEDSKQFLYWKQRTPLITAQPKGGNKTNFIVGYAVSPRYTFTYLMNGQGLRGEGRLQCPSHRGHLGAQLVTSTTSFGTGKHPYLLPEEQENMTIWCLYMLPPESPVFWHCYWNKLHYYESEVESNSWCGREKHLLLKPFCLERH